MIVAGLERQKLTPGCVILSLGATVCPTARRLILVASVHDLLLEGIAPRHLVGGELRASVGFRPSKELARRVFTPLEVFSGFSGICAGSCVPKGESQRIGTARRQSSCACCIAPETVLRGNQAGHREPNADIPERRRHARFIDHSFSGSCGLCDHRRNRAGHFRWCPGGQQHALAASGFTRTRRALRSCNERCADLGRQ